MTANSVSGGASAAFNLEIMRQKTLAMLKRIEQRLPYRSDLSIQESIQRRYNTARSLADYCEKFPTLLDFTKDGMTVLEIGAGEGHALAELSNLYNLSVTATNLTGDANSIAAVASDLPFAAQSFDLVIAIQSVTWEPNQRDALQEIHRVLKPQGRAFVNLYKFSEITALWFGEKFWAEFDLARYRDEYECGDKDLAAAELVRTEMVSGTLSISKSYFIEIAKTKSV